MNISEYTHKIVRNFITHFPTAHKSLSCTNHNEPEMLSNWHLEGNAWTHTMMVVSAMEELAEGRHRIKELLLAALLHDTGKPYTRNINKEKQKVTFYGHPGVSTLLGNDMLSLIDPELTEEQRCYVLYLINHHQLLFNVTGDMSEKAFNKIANRFTHDVGCFQFSDLLALRNADNTGRIARTKHDKACTEQYEILQDRIMYNFLCADDPVREDAPEKPKAVIMVGLPGSGKSTYISKYLSDYTLVSRDAQVEHLGGDLTYNEAFKTVDQQEVDRLYTQVFSTAIQKKENLVVDKTNLTHKSRMKSINRLQDNGYGIEIIVLLPSLFTMHLRNDKREGKTIPRKVIQTMMSSLELPFASEGKVKVIFDF